MKPVTLKVCYVEDSILILHSGMAAKLGLSRKKLAHVSFGVFKHYVNIKLYDCLPEDEAAVSADVLEYLHIPLYAPYELRTCGNEIVIGPCIGLLMHKSADKITRPRLARMLKYIADYTHVNGAIIVFTLDRVDKANRTVEGFCYKHDEGSWEHGVFPYPAAIYRKIPLDNEWQNHFLSNIGDRLFNNRYINKWEMSKWLMEDRSIRPCVPEAILCSSPDDIRQMLQKYKAVYLKPVWGTHGTRVIRINYSRGSIILCYRQHGKNKHVKCEAQDEFARYAGKLLSSGEYLVQAEVKLMQYKGGIIDIRCILQKDRSMVWVCNGIIVRCGAKGSIVSNTASGGTAMLLEDFTTSCLNMDEQAASALRVKIMDLAMKVGGLLDEYGLNKGTLGLDIGIDNKGSLWLIEVNNRNPDPTIALDANDSHTYYKAKSSPLLYAKALAGFKQEDG